MTGANPSCSRMFFFNDSEGLITPSGGTPITDGALGGFPASNAFDGNDSTFWVSNSATSDDDTVDAYVGYDFGAGNDQTISGVRYRTRPDAFGVNEGPRFAQLDYSSDGSNWTTLCQIVNVDAYSASGTTKDWIDKDHYSGGKRYWRIEVTDTGASGRFSIQQASLHVGDDTGTDIITTSSVGVITDFSSATEFSGSVRAAKALDNVQSTRYATNATDGTGRITWDFGPVSAPNLTDLTLKCSDETFGPDEAPIDFTIEWSDDGAIWNVIETITGEAAWTQNETRTYSISSTSDPGEGDDAVVEGRRRAAFMM